MNQQCRSKSRDNRTCNYCKKPKDIKADCRAFKARNKKAQRGDNKGCRKEVNYIDEAKVLTDNPNRLSIENLVEPEVLFTTEESSTWLLDSGAFYHVTPHRSQFRQYSNRHSDLVRVENSQHYAIIGIGTV